MRAWFVGAVLGIALLGPLHAAGQLDPDSPIVSYDGCAFAAVWYTPWNTVPVQPAEYNRWPLPDPTFAPEAKAPTYPVFEAPVVGVDSSHQNAYTIRPDCPRYAAFAQVLSADGATVVDFAVPFTTGCASDPNCPYLLALNALDMLVIVEPQAIGVEEADLLRSWVSGEIGCEDGCEGRGLMVVSSRALLDLGNELGVDWNTEHARGNEFTTCGDPRQEDTYLPGTLIDHHVVSQGLEPSDSVSSVKSFFNGRYECVGGYGCSWSMIRHGNATISLPSASGSTSFLTHSWGNATVSAGIAFELGSGRVYAGSDPEMFTAIIAGPICDNWFGIPVCTDPAPLGMQVHPPNQRYLLNVIHWMDGLLPDSDGDGITDQNDLCRWNPPPVYPPYTF